MNNKKKMGNSTVNHYRINRQTKSRPHITCFFLFLAFFQVYAGQVPVRAGGQICGEEYKVNDIIISPATVTVLDHEFDPVSKRIAFVSENGQLVVSTIDLWNGMLSGTPTIVDDSGLAIISHPIEPYANGAEWANSSSRGVEIYYQKLDASGRIYGAVAKQLDGYDSPWFLRDLSLGDWRGLILPTINDWFTYPVLLYAITPPEMEPTAAIRVDDDSYPVSELEVPGLEITTGAGAFPAKHVIGKTEIVMTTCDADSQPQLTRYNYQTGESEFISQYAPEDNVLIHGVGAGVAPDLDGRMLYIALINYEQLDVFIQEDSGTFRKINSLRPPVGASINKYLTDTESFIRNGRCYMTFTMASSTKTPPVTSDIWIAPALATHNCQFRRINSPDLLSRSDAEPLELAGGMFIYYRGREGRGKFRLHRADTGL